MHDSSSTAEPTAFELVAFEHPTVKLPPLLAHGRSAGNTRVTAVDPPAMVRRAVNRNKECSNGPFDPSPPPDASWALPVPDPQPLNRISPDPEQLTWVAEHLNRVLLTHEQALVHASAGVEAPLSELRAELALFVRAIDALESGADANAA